MPILELALAQSRSNNSFAEAIFDLIKTKQNFVRPTNLQHYEFEFGNFRIKFGFYPFGISSIPTKIHFSGTPFTHRCILAHTWISPHIQNAVMRDDIIKQGIPELDGIQVNVTLNAASGERRRVSYLAIGQ
jgi:hypothetical protein